ncbi:uncharacterized protein H6S33_007597 [Morchella sextelata]|uniref:uncharacterized protein n=1 Tax=Morchella sextelata TaxID=1174677 RepID=UPI001D03F382|nr:uncharacterized protein H6S33_007597 [Morchella sextelata]KAH0603275.1 hypothetical protein H6S33_007597 [Morchella sextelata]
MGDEEGDGGKEVSRIGINKLYDLIKGPSLQTADRMDNLRCPIAGPIMVHFELHSELGNESEDFGPDAIELFRERFRPNHGDSGWCSSSENGDRNIGGGDGVVNIEVKVDLYYLLFQVVNGFVGGGEQCTSTIPLVSDASKNSREVVKQRSSILFVLMVKLLDLVR